MYLSGIREVRDSSGGRSYEILSGIETANIINREIKGPRASTFNVFGIQEVEVFEHDIRLCKNIFVAFFVHPCF